MNKISKVWNIYVYGVMLSPLSPPPTTHFSIPSVRCYFIYDETRKGWIKFSASKQPILNAPDCRNEIPNNRGREIYTLIRANPFGYAGRAKFDVVIRRPTIRSLVPRAHDWRRKFRREIARSLRAPDVCRASREFLAAYSRHILCIAIAPALPSWRGRGRRIGSKRER